MTQSHRKEPHVIRSNTVITSCEKGRKWFLSSVLWIDAKFVGVIEPLRARLFPAVVHPHVWYHFDFTSLSGIIRGLLASNDAVPFTASSLTTASSSTLPSSSLVPFRLYFVFTTVTNPGIIV